MVHGSNTTCILYDVTSQKEGALLRICPLVSSRDFNLTVRSGYLSFFQKALPEGVELSSSNGFTFSLSSNLQSHSDPCGTTIWSTTPRRRGALTFRRISLVRVILKANSNPGFLVFLLLLQQEIFLLLHSSRSINSIQGKQIGGIFLLLIRGLASPLRLSFSRQPTILL